MHITPLSVTFDLLSRQKTAFLLCMIHMLHRKLIENTIQQWKQINSDLMECFIYTTLKSCDKVMDTGDYDFFHSLIILQVLFIP